MSYWDCGREGGVRTGGRDLHLRNHRPLRALRVGFLGPGSSGRDYTWRRAVRAIFLLWRVLGNEWQDMESVEGDIRYFGARRTSFFPFCAARAVQRLYSSRYCNGWPKKRPPP